MNISSKLSITNNLSIKLIGLLSAIVLTAFIYAEGITEITRRWMEEDEYSHGPLLLLLAVFFIYRNHDEIISNKPYKNFLGPVIIGLSALFYIAGEISSLFILMHYAFVATIYGIFISIYGLKSSRYILPSLVLVFFAIPLPYFLQTELTISLQLVSSQIGVAIIKALSIPAFLEGNSIDLGTIQLQVVEACAGLRYMFSLMSFGFICAYLYHVAVWRRVLIFLSTIPITILMNSTRIAATGILAHYAGPETAEGFIHTFQGVAIFSVCLIILFFEMWLLTKIGREKPQFLQVFGLEKKEPPSEKVIDQGVISTPYYISSLLLILTLLLTSTLKNREEIIPERTSLIHFPTTIQGWQGRTQTIEHRVIKKLRLTDYISADYISEDHKLPVNLYIAYYDSQSKGASPHSPRVCIPGGGWEISDISRRENYVNSIDSSIAYNRAVISKGQTRQLVYYWFQQRGRYIANEYYMKWYLFVDSIFKNRTDGSLVRLVTPIYKGEDIDTADQRLLEFSGDVAEYLNDYIPN